jgi:hypothetical protein
MPHRAKVDADRIYWGVESVTALADGDFEVPADCDCTPGAYRLSADGLRLEPLPPQQQRTAPDVVSTEMALAELIDFVAAQGGPELPAKVQAWRTEMKNSFDAIGSKT